MLHAPQYLCSWLIPAVLMLQSFSQSHVAAAMEQVIGSGRCTSLHCESTPGSHRTTQEKGCHCLATQPAPVLSRPAEAACQYCPSTDARSAAQDSTAESGSVEICCCHSVPTPAAPLANCEPHRWTEFKLVHSLYSDNLTHLAINSPRATAQCFKAECLLTNSRQILFHVWQI